MTHGTAVRLALGSVAVIAILALSAPTGAAQDSPLDRAREEAKTFKLLSDADLYCSIFILGDERPEIKILSAERGDEKVLLSDTDLCFINKGAADGIALDQVYLVVEAGPDVVDTFGGHNLGALGQKRGRARVVAVDDERSTVRLEKCCGQVMVGHYLVPFTAKDVVLGQERGIEPAPLEGQGISGRIIYLENTLEQVGTNYWAIINLGNEHGLAPGQQVIAFRRVRDEVPRQAVANLVVIDVGMSWATVKVLTAKDVLRVGTEVQTR
ncbi:MAG: hypothetical protein JW742_02765 [Candidatus Aminicenantes bacterium]|nr:hypothetical protein [Candidatus Aminicenantes bacterium]